MIGTSLGHDPLHLKTLSSAPHTRVLVSIFRLRLTLLSKVILASRTMIFTIADLAVDLIIRTLDAVEIVNGGLALDTRETLLMIQSSLGDHLLSLEHLASTPGAGLSVSILPGDDGGVPGYGVLARPVDVLAADVAVDLIVWSNSCDVDTDGTSAVGTRHTFL